MAIRDEYIKVLRSELGAGYTRATWDALAKAYVAQSLRGKVLAVRKASLDDAALVAARSSVEQVLREEEAARKNAEDNLAAALDQDIRNF